MVETRWEDIRDEEVRYLDHTWKLTGKVGIRDRGELLAVEAHQVDDVRRRGATLYFGLDGDGPRGSLNPGNLGEYFNRLERDDEGVALVVKTDGRSYRYELQRMEHD